MEDISKREIAKRLQLIKEKLGLSIKELAQITQMPYRTLYNYLSGEREPTPENLQKLVAHLGININWLLTGEGKMFIKKPRWLEEKEELEDMAQEFGAEIIHPVPVLGYIPAGFPTEIPDDAVIEWIYLPEVPKGSFVFKAKGDSMSPIIKDGDYIVVHPHRDIVSGNIVVYQNEWGEVCVKRYRVKGGKVFLVPENPDYPTIEFDPEQHRIIGKVIDIWTRKKTV